MSWSPLWRQLSATEILLKDAMDRAVTSVFNEHVESMLFKKVRNHRRQLSIVFDEQ